MFVFYPFDEVKGGEKYIVLRCGFFLFHFYKAYQCWFYSTRNIVVFIK